MQMVVLSKCAIEEKEDNGATKIIRPKQGVCIHAMLINIFTVFNVEIVDYKGAKAIKFRHKQRPKHGRRPNRHDEDGKATRR